MRSWLVKIYDDQGFLQGVQFAGSTQQAYRIAREGSLGGFAVTKLQLDESSENCRMTWFKTGERLFFEQAESE